MRGTPLVPGRAHSVAAGRAVLAALALLGILTPAAPIAAQATDQPAAPTAEAAPVRGAEARLHALVNRRREAIGCPRLSWHAPSAVVAEQRSADMIERRYFDHVTPDGRTVFDQVADAGIEAWGSIAENIALTQAGAPSVLEMWRDSPPHRRNLDNCSFTHHGLGEHGGVWTQILLAHPKRPEPDGTFSRSEPANPRR